VCPLRQWSITCSKVWAWNGIVCDGFCIWSVDAEGVWWSYGNELSMLPHRRQIVDDPWPNTLKNVSSGLRPPWSSAASEPQCSKDNANVFLGHRYKLCEALIEGHTIALEQFKEGIVHIIYCRSLRGWRMWRLSHFTLHFGNAVIHNAKIVLERLSESQTGIRGAHCVCVPREGMPTQGSERLWVLAKQLRKQWERLNKSQGSECQSS
jgi:hypothetical protein